MLVINFNIDEPFCFNVPLALISKDLGAIKVAVLLIEAGDVCTNHSNNNN